MQITFEPITETTIPIAIIPQINREKLLIHNLQSPMDKRIHGDDLQVRLEYAHARGNLVALQATIHTEVDPVIEREWRKWETL